MSNKNLWDLLVIHCSPLPLLAHCSAAVVDDGVRLASQGPEADLGTAGHKLQADWIKGAAADPVHVARALGVDHDELQRMFTFGQRAWRQFEPHFPQPRTEVTLQSCFSDIVLTGRLDVLSFTSDSVRVLDWKTGWAHGEHDDQLRGYALLGLTNQPNPEARAYAVTVRLREGTAEGVWYTADELLDWWERLSHRLLHEQDRFSPGPHCGRCPRAATCPAKTALIRQAVAALVDGERLGVAALGEMVARARWLQGELERWLELAKAEVRLYGGKLPGLELVEQRQRRIECSPALPVLSEFLDDDAIERCCSISKNKVEKEVSALAPRGKKGAAVKELLERLDAAGALSTTMIERLELRRAPQPEIIHATANQNPLPAPGAEGPSASAAGENPGA